MQKTAPRPGDPKGPEDRGASDPGIRRPRGARAHHAASTCSGGANGEETRGSTSGEVRGGAKTAISWMFILMFIYNDIFLFICGYFF